MQSTRRLPIPLALTLLVVLVSITFSPVVSFDFTSWDDYDTVARNPRLAPPTPRSMVSFWTEPHMDLYVPATYTLWALVANASPQAPVPPVRSTLNPRAFHGLNLMLHVAAACVVLLILHELFASAAAALAGALVFAVHPVQVEPVAWVSGMKDVLFGLLALVAIWQYLRLARDHARGVPLLPSERWGRFALATTAFVLAMLAKPTAVVVPVVVIVIDRILIGRQLKQVLRSAWPWLVLAVPCVIWTKLAQPAVHAQEAAAIWARPLVAADALAFYLSKLIWPATLAFDYGRTPQRVLASGAAYWSWIVPTVVALGVWRWKRRTPALAAGGIVFVVVLLPVLGLVPFDFQAYSMVADHYLYLAVLGVAMIVAWGLSRTQKLASFTAAAIIVAALGMRSFAQTWTWRNSHSLFTHALQVNPQSFASYNNLAMGAFEAGDADAAIDLAERAVQANPTYAGVHLTLGLAHTKKGDLPAATKAFRRTLELDPGETQAMSNLARVLAEQGEVDEARPLARKSVELDPHEPAARIILGTLLAGRGEIAAAAREYEAALELAPSHPIAHANLGVLKLSRGESRQAEQHFRAALAADPDNAIARQGLAEIAPTPGQGLP
ncbi:MAG: tetratricopeptide repeat protein [Tepidisphaeraceae bacterium]